VTFDCFFFSTFFRCGLFDFRGKPVVRSPFLWRFENLQGRFSFLAPYGWFFSPGENSGPVFSLVCRTLIFHLLSLSTWFMICYLLFTLFPTIPDQCFFFLLFVPGSSFLWSLLLHFFFLLFPYTFIRSSLVTISIFPQSLRSVVHFHRLVSFSFFVVFFLFFSTSP